MLPIPLTCKQTRKNQVVCISSKVMTKRRTLVLLEHTDISLYTLLKYLLSSLTTARGQSDKFRRYTHLSIELHLKLLHSSNSHFPQFMEAIERKENCIQ